MSAPLPCAFAESVGEIIRPCHHPAAHVDGGFCVLHLPVEQAAEIVEALLREKVAMSQRIPRPVNDIVSLWGVPSAVLHLLDDRLNGAADRITIQVRASHRGGGRVEEVTTATIDGVEVYLRGERVATPAEVAKLAEVGCDEMVLRPKRQRAVLAPVQP